MLGKLCKFSWKVLKSVLLLLHLHHLSTRVDCLVCEFIILKLEHGNSKRVKWGRWTRSKDLVKGLKTFESEISSGCMRICEIIAIIFGTSVFCSILTFILSIFMIINILYSSTWFCWLLRNAEMPICWERISQHHVLIKIIKSSRRKQETMNFTLGKNLCVLSFESCFFLWLWIQLLSLM